MRECLQFIAVVHCLMTNIQKNELKNLVEIDTFVGGIYLFESNRYICIPNWYICWQKDTFGTQIDTLDMVYIWLNAFNSNTNHRTFPL